MSKINADQMREVLYKITNKHVDEKNTKRTRNKLIGEIVQCVKKQFNIGNYKN